jgi:hypothetical protein
LSFGSETGRTRSGTKGVSGKAKKKEKRKKQEYHMHRGHFHEEEQLSPEQLRARTVLGLDRLGHQVISMEPGGYDLQAWVRSLNSLLEDFEEKIGPEKVTDEFRKRRDEALAPLAAPSASGDVDSEIRKLTEEEEVARTVLSDLDRQTGEKIASLREQRDACQKALKVERERLAEFKATKQSRQFFSRLIRSGPSTADAEEKVSELESKLKELEDEMERSKKARIGKGDGAPKGTDPARVQAQERLEEIRKRLFELQSASQGRLQLALEREVATKAIADAISSMKVGGASPAEGASQGP